MVAAGCQPQSPTSQTMSKRSQKELQEIDALIAKVFDAICFNEGERPNMFKLKDLFIEGGLLINYNEQEPLSLPVSEFVPHFENVVESGAIPSLEDKEVFQKTEIYDRIAHRFSFYEARFKKEDEEPFARGVNSLQLIKTSDGWKVSSMAWNDDNRGDGFFDLVMNSNQ